MATATGPADAELVLRARAGDQSAFEALVLRHGDRLHAALRRFGLTPTEADEVAQETLLRAWRALPRFEARASFFTWLYRIAFNEAQRRLARRPPAPPLGEDALAELADPGPTTERAAEHQELSAALDRGLLALPAELRAAVVLRDVEGLSTRDAAGVLDLKEAAFKSRLHRGRMQLRAGLVAYLQ
jgi:RNA polymerase sigma-70 factor (ECF subfamily)